MLDLIAALFSKLGLLPIAIMNKQFSMSGHKPLSARGQEWDYLVHKPKQLQIIDCNWFGN